MLQACNQLTIYLRIHGSKTLQFIPNAATLDPGFDSAAVTLCVVNTSVVLYTG